MRMSEAVELIRAERERYMTLVLGDIHPVTGDPAAVRARLGLPEVVAASEAFQAVVRDALLAVNEDERSTLAVEIAKLCGLGAGVVSAGWS